MKYTAIKLSAVFLLILICAAILFAVLDMKNNDIAQLTYQDEDGNLYPRGDEYLKGLEFTYDFYSPGRKLTQKLCQNKYDETFSIQTSMKAGQYAFHEIPFIDEEQLFSKQIKHDTDTEFTINGYRIVYTHGLGYYKLQIEKNGDIKQLKIEMPFDVEKTGNPLSDITNYLLWLASLQNSMKHCINAVSFSDIIVIRGQSYAVAVDLANGQAVPLPLEGGDFCFVYQGNVMEIYFMDALTSFAEQWHNDYPYQNNLYVLLKIRDIEGKILGVNLFDSGYNAKQLQLKVKNFAIRKV